MTLVCIKKGGCDHWLPQWFRSIFRQFFSNVVIYSPRRDKVLLWKTLVIRFLCSEPDGIMFGFGEVSIHSFHAFYVSNLWCKPESWHSSKIQCKEWILGESRWKMGGKIIQSGSLDSEQETESGAQQ